MLSLIFSCSRLGDKCVDDSAAAGGDVSLETQPGMNQAILQTRIAKDIALLNIFITFHSDSENFSQRG